MFCISRQEIIVEYRLSVFNQIKRDDNDETTLRVITKYQIFKK